MMRNLLFAPDTGRSEADQRPFDLEDADESAHQSGSPIAHVGQNTEAKMRSLGARPLLLVALSLLLMTAVLLTVMVFRLPVVAVLPLVAVALLTAVAGFAGAFGSRQTSHAGCCWRISTGGGGERGQGWRRRDW